jgi:hypothetical protein
MTKIRMFMFAALAVIVAFGVCGQQALALDPHFKTIVVGRAPVSDAVPDAAAQVHQAASLADGSGLGTMIRQQGD